MPDHFIPLTYGKKQENYDAAQKAYPEERPMSVGLCQLERKQMGVHVKTILLIPPVRESRKRTR